MPDSSVAVRPNETYSLAQSKVGRLQAAMSQMSQFDGFETQHYFANGMYARSVWRPAGVTTVGKLHRHEHFSILLSGRVTIHTEHGPRDYEAPAVFTTAGGNKRAIYAHTDATFMTVHRLDPDTRDLDEIERQVINEEQDLPALFTIENKLKDPSLSGPAEQKALES